MSAGGFGTVIPVLSLNLGFPGNISRVGERVIKSRQVLSTTANPLYFGQGAVIVPDSVGGTVQSIADFINGGGNFSASNFAGVAVRNVKTNLNYSTLGNLGAPTLGSFAQGQQAGVLERGSTVVNITHGTPVSQNPVFVRTALNGAIPAGLVGDFEAVADGTIAAVAGGGNTGNGTVTGLVIGASADNETYTINFTSATAYLVANDAGNIIGYGSIVATTAKTSLFSSKYVSFLLTQGSATFVSSDTFTITVSALLTIGLPDVVFMTGVQDGNGNAEITLKNRVAA
jgi:hypothetical protein